MADTPRKPLRLDYLTFRLDVLSGLAKRQGSALYEHEFGVSLRELRVLRLVLQEPGMTQNRLVEVSYLDKTIVSKLVTKLVQRGLLERRVGAPDARFVNLFLTADAQALMQRAGRMGRKLERVMLTAALTAGEREAFEAALQKLIDWLDAQPPPGPPAR